MGSEWPALCVAETGREVVLVLVVEVVGVDFEILKLNRPKFDIANLGLSIIFPKANNTSDLCSLDERIKISGLSEIV